MDTAIKEIVKAIPSGLAFDAHYIIATLIRDYSDTYLIFARTFTAQTNVTPIMHSAIAKRIDQLDSTVIERQEAISYSYNIRGNASECTLWVKK